MSTLHDRIRAVVEDRLRIAREAVGVMGPNWVAIHGSVEVDGDTKGRDPFDWTVCFDEGSPTEAQALHIAANDPADAILGAEHALDVLERHAPAYDEPGLCRFCFGQDGEDYYPYPCPEVRALATRWRVEVDG